MPAQVMKASYNGWVDFTKGLVEMPASAPRTTPAAERNHSEARREGGRMDGLRLAIAGLPMSFLTLAAVPALAQTNANLAELPTTTDMPRLVEAMDESPSPAMQMAIRETSGVKMISPASTGSVIAPTPNDVQARAAMTLPAPRSETPDALSESMAATVQPMNLPTSQVGIALMSGAGGLLLARRRSPIK